MRYCGNCGASLSPEIGGYDGFDDYGGSGAVCPSCGKPIRPMDDLEAVHTVDIAREPTHRPLDVLDREYLPGLPASAEREGTDPPTMRRSARRFPFKPMTLLALVAVTLLLALGSALLLNNALRNQQPNPAGNVPVGSRSPATGLVVPSTTQTTQTAQASPTGSGFSGPLASPAASPAPGSTATGPATPGGSATPATPTPTPTLAVAPLKITLSTCISASTQFTVTNMGGGTMSWSASPSDRLYNVSPQGGFLSKGQQQTVTVRNITLNGTITVSASGAANSPQTVTITCALR
ncbi:MAG: hypothetical protein ACM3N4_06365 [Nitrososphaerota archaeon]